MTDQEFKEALACWCSGVSVVFTRASDGRMYGLTVSSFSSVSMNPPLVMVCIDNRNRFSSMVDASGRFSVSILQSGQEAASNYYARSGREPVAEFEEIPGELTPLGQPVLSDCLGWIGCELYKSVEAGDHTILIGRVTETHASDQPPLLYYRRAYRTATDT